MAAAPTGRRSICPVPWPRRQTTRAPTGCRDWRASASAPTKGGRCQASRRGGKKQTKQKKKKKEKRQKRQKKRQLRRGWVLIRCESARERIRWAKGNHGRRSAARW